MIFGKSGKKALELADAHFTKVHECYSTYVDCVVIYFKEGGTAEACALFERIDRLEQEADDILAALVRHLQSGALLPSTRREIMKLCKMADMIANDAQCISRRMVIENVFFPEDIKPGLLDIVCCTKTQLEALPSVVELLVADGYEGQMLDDAAVQEVKSHEKKIDALEREVLRQLFSMDISLAEKNHAKYFITRMEEISDLIEDIADEIQMMLVFRKV